MATNTEVLTFVRDCYTPEYHRFVCELACASHTYGTDGRMSMGQTQHVMSLLDKVKSQRDKMVKVIRVRMANMVIHADEAETLRLEDFAPKLKNLGLYLEALYRQLDDRVATQMLEERRVMQENTNNA